MSEVNDNVSVIDHVLEPSINERFPVHSTRVGEAAVKLAAEVAVVAAVVAGTAVLVREVIRRI